MTIAQRNQVIESAFALRDAELRCQAAEAQALTTFLAAPDKGAHWRGMAESGKRLIVAQALDRGGYAVTEEAIALGIAKYEDRYEMAAR